MTGGSRTERAVFFLLLGVYGFFHQGGGWHQNSRFVQARAIVEAGRLSVEDFILRKPLREHPPVLFPAPFVPSEDVRKQYKDLSTLDLSLHDGHLYPNKPPGVTLLVLPAYALLYATERALGIDPDDWLTLTLNLFIVSVVSVGLLGAWGGVVFLRTSRRLFPDLPEVSHLGATLTLGLGTLFLPYATMLFDHVPAAVLLLAAFARLLSPGAEKTGAPNPAVSAGLCAGAAVLMNYNAVLAVVPLAIYAGASRWRPFVLGGLALPAVLLGVYHAVCFGHPFTLAQSLSVIPIPWTAPDPQALVALLFSAYRGLFFSSPVLLLSAFGFRHLWRNARRREALLFAFVFAAFLGMNVCFLNWHGGGAFGARYLIPSLPFLALPLAPAFRLWPRVSALLGVMSAAVMLLVTAVDPQVPPSVCHPLRDFYLPLAAGETVRTPTLTTDGPVSAHRGGVFLARSDRQARWHSFNLGELLFPSSLFSLAPLLLGLGASVGRLCRPRAPKGAGRV